MKKLSCIIPVLVLSLILSFAPACGNSEASINVQELLKACEQGNLEDVEGLLEKDVNVNSKDKSGDSALIIATRNRHTEIAELLIANGANVNAKAENGITPLMAAAKHGYTEIKDLLKAAGAQE